MDLVYAGDNIKLPELVLSLSVREHVVRISSPVVIVNMTGQPMEFCENANRSAFIPHCLYPETAEHFIGVRKSTASKHAASFSIKHLVGPT